MLKLSIAAWIWLASPLVSASTDSTGEPLPVISTSTQFMNGLETRIDWGECFGLKFLTRENLGSIDIPCPHESGLDNICTIYADKNCEEEIITFDRPHYDLLTLGDRPQEKPIGRRAASVKCRMRVTDREGHIWRISSASSSFGRSCPGDACTEDKECEMSPRMFHNYECTPTSKTCKQRRLLNSQVPR